MTEALWLLVHGSVTVCQQNCVSKTSNYGFTSNQTASTVSSQWPTCQNP